MKDAGPVNRERHFMAKTNDTKREASIIVNGVLVDVIDHGNVETPWGNHPRITLRFETDRMDAAGKPTVIERTFNHYRYSKSALTLNVKDWLGIDLSVNDDVDLQDYIGTPAKLGCDERPTESGKKYLNVIETHAAGDVKVKPSGNYTREVEI